ncbi:MAG: DUF5777 family beta-barrel protein [Bacteroidota bacterium]|nr:DUF5777 family beta-barrel protein [Bacteroidota bacterium]
MRHLKNKQLSLLLFIIISYFVQAQSLDELMAASEKPKTEYTIGTFKGTKILNSQSVEGVGKGVLQVMFQHRFGTLFNGAYDFFGLDNAGIRFGFDYGITNRLTIGVGRSGGGVEPNGQKAYDGYFKLKLLRQSSGEKVMPFSVSLFASTAIKSSNNFDETDKLPYRLFYTGQLIIARKFSNSFSAQIMPTVVHRNLTDTPEDKNTIFSMGMAARMKLTKRFGLIVEYYYNPVNQQDSKYYNHIAAFGLEIETGGHVYHLLFTNGSGMIEHQFIGYNTFPIYQGAQSIRFGFNLSRVFTLIKYND